VGMLSIQQEFSLQQLGGIVAQSFRCTYHVFAVEE
jgi:hypothetical protein